LEIAGISGAYDKDEFRFEGRQGFQQSLKQHDRRAGFEASDAAKPPRLTRR
jgi:hypothetical protein